MEVEDTPSQRHW
jgi:hypothetical protein